MQPATLAAHHPPGTDHPVLAIHSSLSSGSQWRSLAAMLGPRCRFLAADLHGYGGNPLPAAGTSHRLEDEVDLVEARAAEAFGSRQPVHVVGHSYGGAVALSLARRHPERVLSLTLFEPVCMSLLEPGAPYGYAMRLIADRVADLVQAGDLAEAARLFIDYWGGAGSYDSHDADTRQRFDRAVRKVPLDYAALRGGPANAAGYAGIAAPTQLMVGGASLESARTIARILWAAIPGATLLELPGDHLMPMRNAAPVNREIARFLQSVEDATPLRRTGT